MTDSENEEEMTPEAALDKAIEQRAYAQARWHVISPIVKSLREIRKANHLAERFGAAFREAQ